MQPKCFPKKYILICKFNFITQNKLLTNINQQFYKTIQRNTNAESERKDCMSALNEKRMSTLKP